MHGAECTRVFNNYRIWNVFCILEECWFFCHLLNVFGDVIFISCLQFNLLVWLIVAAAHSEENYVLGTSRFWKLLTTLSSFHSLSQILSPMQRKWSWVLRFSGACRNRWTHPQNSFLRHEGSNYSDMIWTNGLCLIQNVEVNTISRPDQVDRNHMLLHCKVINIVWLHHCHQKGGVKTWPQSCNIAVSPNNHRQIMHFFGYLIWTAVAARNFNRKLGEYTKDSVQLLAITSWIKFRE